MHSLRLLKATVRDIRNLLRVGHAATILPLGVFDTATYAEHRDFRPASHDFAVSQKRRMHAFRMGTLLREDVTISNRGKQVRRGVE